MTCPHSQWFFSLRVDSTDFHDPSPTRLVLVSQKTQLIKSNPQEPRTSTAPSQPAERRQRQQWRNDAQRQCEMLWNERKNTKEWDKAWHKAWHHFEFNYVQLCSTAHIRQTLISKNVKVSLKLCVTGKKTQAETGTIWEDQRLKVGSWQVSLAYLALDFRFTQHHKLTGKTWLTPKRKGTELFVFWSFFFRYQLQVWTSFECWNIQNHRLSDIIRKIHSIPQLSPSFACSWWAAPLAARGTAPSALWALVHPARREPSAPKTSTSRGSGRCEIRHQSLWIGDGSKPWYPWWTPSHSW